MYFSVAVAPQDKKEYINSGVAAPLSWREKEEKWETDQGSLLMKCSVCEGRTHRNRRIPIKRSRWLSFFKSPIQYVLLSISLNSISLHHRVGMVGGGESFSAKMKLAKLCSSGRTQQQQQQQPVYWGLLIHISERLILQMVPDIHASSWYSHFPPFMNSQQQNIVTMYAACTHECLAENQQHVILDPLYRWLRVHASMSGVVYSNSGADTALASLEAGEKIDI